MPLNISVLQYQDLFKEKKKVLNFRHICEEKLVNVVEKHFENIRSSP